MVTEFHVNCSCGLGRVYRSLGVARAMRTRFSHGPEESEFYHWGCGGRLVLTEHPEGVITDGRGRPLILAKKEEALIATAGGAGPCAILSMSHIRI